jgi:hypothetical protein
MCIQSLFNCLTAYSRMGLPGGREIKEAGGKEAAIHQVIMGHYFQALKGILRGLPGI